MDASGSSLPLQSHVDVHVPGDMTPREKNTFLGVALNVLIQQEAFETVQQNQVTWTGLEGFREGLHRDS